MFQIYRVIDRFQKKKKKKKPTNHTNLYASFSASTFATVPDLLLFAYLGLQVDAGCGAQVQIQYGGYGI